MKKIGKYVYEFEKPCGIFSYSTIVGDKEKNGVFKKYFNDIVYDDKVGQKTFEQVSEIIQSRVQIFLNEKAK